ncbi:MAG: glycerol-3-phosphate dehydrogenase, partial [Chloroflexota bacterium]
SRLNWLVAPERARGLAPGLRLDRLRSCALYADAWTNDARLTLANVRAAADAGAVVLNGAEVVSLRFSSSRVAGAEVLADGEVVAVEARAVVNAAGPWVDEVRRLESPLAGTSVRLSKGVHALVPAQGEWQAALTVLQDHVRVTFAIPWYGMLLLGTTDALHEGDPDDVRAEPADVEQILAEAAVALDPELVRPERVRAVFAGLRVLPAGEGESVSARRETVYTVGPGGMVSVAGGKLTTYRAIALGALARLRSTLQLRRLDTRPWPLPGAENFARTRLPVEVGPDVRAHLLHLYGSLAAEVLAPAVEDAALLEPLHPDGPDLAAQALYAVTHEWARSAEDVARRRTTLFHRGLATEEALARIGEIAGRAASTTSG